MFYSGQSKTDVNSAKTNQNSKRKHVTGAKRGKTRASKSWVGKMARVFLRIPTGKRLISSFTQLFLTEWKTNFITRGYKFVQRTDMLALLHLSSSSSFWVLSSSSSSSIWVMRASSLRFSSANDPLDKTTRQNVLFRTVIYREKVRNKVSPCGTNDVENDLAVAQWKIPKKFPNTTAENLFHKSRAFQSSSRSVELKKGLNEIYQSKSYSNDVRGAVKAQC